VPNDHVALVTGGSRPCGRGICLALAKLGYAVILNHHANLEAAMRTRNEVEQAGGRADFCISDLTQPADRDLLIEHVLEHFGRLDVLVNGAGTAPQPGPSLLEITPKQLTQMLEVNLAATLFLTQRAVRSMLDLKAAGTIDNPMVINISSIYGQTADLPLSAYCLSKAPMGMLTKLLAAQLAKDGVAVYEVRTGWIAEEMLMGGSADAPSGAPPTLTRRWGRADDVARAVAALVRGDLPYSTGAVIPVDGGWTACGR
jgi:NAD(P)-dependent dehydrogenase (short-subunit alcohol dehydrogenase family)